MVWHLVLPLPCGIYRSGEFGCGKRKEVKNTYKINRERVSIGGALFYGLCLFYEFQEDNMQEMEGRNASKE